MGAQQPDGPRLLTVGNILTTLRLVLLPFIVVGIACRLGYVVVAAMGAAIVTDLLDGRLARRLRQASDLGRNLDSTVDFVLIYSLFIAFYVGGRLETYQFGVLYVAMLLNLLVQMASLGLLEAGGLARTIAGKPTGALQYGYLLFLVAREVMPSTHTVVLIDRIFFGVLAVAIAANCIECAIRLRRFR